MLNILIMIRIFSGSKGPHGPDLPSPFGRKFHFALQLDPYLGSLAIVEVGVSFIINRVGIKAEWSNRSNYLHLFKWFVRVSERLEEWSFPDHLA